MAIAAAFDPGLFIVPRDAHQWILSKVKRWRDAQPARLSGLRVWAVRRPRSPIAPGDLVLSLAGEPGVGKSWLLRYLAEEERRMARSAVYIDLERRIRYPDPEAYIRTVEALIHRQCGSDRAVLLLDSVPPHLDEYLRVLEDSILRPHVAHRGSLVIMAVMHPSQVCWRAPALRGGDRHVLRSFDEPHTRSQLQCLQKMGMTNGKPEPSTVGQYSGGLPLLNYLLSTRERAEAFALLLEHWFSRIPYDERECIQRYLEAVCLLDVLEYASIQRALEVYYHYWPATEGCPAHAGGVRNSLRKYWLARPATDAPGQMVLVESVRLAVQEVLKAKSSELYALLEEAVRG